MTAVLSFCCGVLVVALSLYLGAAVLWHVVVEVWHAVKGGPR